MTPVQGASREDGRGAGMLGGGGDKRRHRLPPQGFSAPWRLPTLQVPLLLLLYDLQGGRKARTGGQGGKRAASAPVQRPAVQPSRVPRQALGPPLGRYPTCGRQTQSSEPAARAPGLRAAAALAWCWLRPAGCLPGAAACCWDQIGAAKRGHEVTVKVLKNKATLWPLHATTPLSSRYLLPLTTLLHRVWLECGGVAAMRQRECKLTGKQSHLCCTLQPAKKAILNTHQIPSSH